VFERLTKTKKNRRSNQSSNNDERSQNEMNYQPLLEQGEEEDEELTFSPEINKKSRYMISHTTTNRNVFDRLNSSHTTASNHSQYIPPSSTSSTSSSSSKKNNLSSNSQPQQDQRNVLSSTNPQSPSTTSSSSSLNPSLNHHQTNQEEEEDDVVVVMVKKKKQRRINRLYEMGKQTILKQRKVENKKKLSLESLKESLPIETGMNEQDILMMVEEEMNNEVCIFIVNYI